MADEKTFTKDELDAAIKAATDKVQESIDKLEAKNEELIAENRKAKADLRKTQDIKPEDVAAIEAERDKALADLAAAQKAAKDATTAKEKAEKALETESSFTQRLLVQDGLKSALIANGVKDEDFIDTLAARFARDAKVTVEGEERKALIGDKPLSDYIKEWAASDAGKKFVAAPANGGGGAPGGKTGEAGKTMLRSAFDALGHAERSAFAKDGGKVVDEAA